MTISSIFATGVSNYTSGKTSTEYVQKLEKEFASIFDEANFSKTVNKFVDAQIDSLNPFSSAGSLVANSIMPGGGLIDKLLGGVISKSVNKFLDATGISQYTNKFFGAIKDFTHNLTSKVFGGSASSASSHSASKSSKGSGSGSSSIGQSISNACSKIGSAIKSVAEKVTKALSGSKSEKA